MVGIQQHHVQIRTGDGRRNARHAAARAHVQQACAASKLRHQSQAVQQVVADHALFLADGSQVVGLVPLGQQAQIAFQQVDLLFAQLQADGGQAGGDVCAVGHVVCNECLDFWIARL